MKLCFDSIEEVKSFVGSLKGTRGKGKGDDEGEGSVGGAGQQAPAPLQPPLQQPAFNPQPQPALTPPQGSPFLPAQNAGDPVVAGLVQRIVGRIDAATASGQSAESALNWFRGQCGAEASAATLDQIKTVFLPKLTVVGLEQIAKLMGA